MRGGSAKEHGNTVPIWGNRSHDRGLDEVRAHAANDGVDLALRVRGVGVDIDIERAGSKPWARLPSSIQGRGGGDGREENVGGGGKVGGGRDQQCLALFCSLLNQRTESR